MSSDDRTNENSDSDDNKREEARPFDEQRFVEALVQKIWEPDFYPLPWFEAVLCYLLRREWNGVTILRVMVTTEGQLVGWPQRSPDEENLHWGPHPMWSFGTFEGTVRKICKLADSAELTNAERAYLLNRLPKPWIKSFDESLPEA